jgi:Flp pilus assembly protein TadB
MTERMKSEGVVVSAPMSFAGSAQRSWKLTRDRSGWVKPLVVAGVLLLILLWWSLVLVWYVVFGILLVPYRLIRRGGRKRKRSSLQHREVLDAIARNQPTPPPPTP